MDTRQHSALADLACAARAGDAQAYGSLVRLTQPLVSAAVRQVVRDPHEAEDLVQETYLRAFGLLGRLREPAAVVAWLQRIARSVALNHRRRRRWSLADDGELDDLPGPAPAAAPEAETAGAALAHALVRLSPEDRRLCDRYYHGGWTTARLAAALSLSEPAVRKRLQRLRDQLREEMAMHRHEDLPGRIVDLLSRPDLTALPENPVGAIWEEFRRHFPDFDLVTLPEQIDQDQAGQVLDGPLAPGGPLEEYLQYIDGQHGLRRDLTLAMLTTALRLPGKRKLIAAGKAYRTEDEEGPTRVHAFHQAEVLWIEEGLDEWQMMGRVAAFVDQLTGGARLRVLQVRYPLYGDRGWEVSAQWPGEEWSSLCGWCRMKADIVTRLGYDAARYAAVGVGMGLDRIACLRYGIEDIRRMGALRV